MIERELLRAVTNAVLALYGEQEPYDVTEVGVVAARLNELAAAKRRADDEGEPLEQEPSEQEKQGG